jgi:hypothetical protein
VYLYLLQNQESEADVTESEDSEDEYQVRIFTALSELCTYSLDLSACDSYAWLLVGEPSSGCMLYRKSTKETMATTRWR